MANDAAVKTVTPKTVAPKTGGSFLKNISPDLIIGIASVFAGGGSLSGLFGGRSMGGVGNIFSGLNSGSNYGSDYGNDYNSYGNGYENNNNSGSSTGKFLLHMLEGFGIALLAKGLLSKFVGSKTVEDKAPAEAVKDPAATTKPAAATVVKSAASVKAPALKAQSSVTNYAKLNEWADKNIQGGACSNLQITKPEYRTIMDAYHAGGNKDKVQLAKAKEIYIADFTAFAKDGIKPYDKNGDGTLNYKEFLNKSITESKRELEAMKKADPELKDEFKTKAATDAAQLAFKRLSRDGKSVTEKDLAMIYALADLKTEGHKDLALGDISITSYQALCSVLGDPDVIKNDKTKKETKNTIAEQIKDAYGFFFPKSA